MFGLFLQYIRLFPRFPECDSTLTEECRFRVRPNRGLSLRRGVVESKRGKIWRKDGLRVSVGTEGREISESSVNLGKD